ncbi:MAG TPA: DUF192 domain-containing protein [Ilumatobacteraceae bacterium]|nr:DUF192 domain-containing protein [Ilumatobacteraceae bacterium]
MAAPATAWLVCEGHVLATADIATDRRAKRRGLLGRDDYEGALVIEGCRWIHTMGMRFVLDVAYLNESGHVLKTVRMAPNRIGLPVTKAARVIEAQAGAFARWGLNVGADIEIRT